MNLLQLAAPTTFGVTLPEVQAHVRSTESAEASYLTTLIARAQSAIENRYGIAVTEQSWKLTLDEFPQASDGRILLPRPPVIEITEIKYVGGAGTEVALLTSDYQLDADSWPGRLYPPVSGSWPAAKAGVPSSVRIKYKAGFKGPDRPLPTAISQAMLLLIGHWYENREGGDEPWSVIDALIGNFIPQAAYDQ